MNWQSHGTVEYNGKVFGQKDIEFKKFLALPKAVHWPMEVAVAGSGVPLDLLTGNGWSINNAEKVTLTFDSFRQYISYCRGEFSVCKNVFVANATGWFSDKSAAYLASGRPVILQDTGFSKHLPVGEGLFAFNSTEEARDSINEIESNYKFHSRKAKELAAEYLEARKVMKTFLNQLGL